MNWRILLSIVLFATLQIVLSRTLVDSDWKASLTLRVQQGNTQISSNDFAAAHGITPEDQIVYFVTNINGGRFTRGDRLEQTSFTFSQDDVSSGMIVFIYTGNGEAPVVDIELRAGDSTYKPTVQVMMGEVEARPVGFVYSLQLNKGQRLTLNPDMLSTTDVASDPRQVIFQANNIQHGRFEKNRQPVTVFTQYDINNGMIDLVHDNSRSRSIVMTLSVTNRGGVTSEALDIAVNQDAPTKGTRKRNQTIAIVFGVLGAVALVVILLITLIGIAALKFVLTSRKKQVEAEEKVIDARKV